VIFSKNKNKIKKYVIFCCFRHQKQAFRDSEGQKSAFSINSGPKIIKLIIYEFNLSVNIIL